MIDLHYIQLKVLKKLLFSEGLGLHDLRPDDSIENNQLLFHVESLMKDGLVEKQDKTYILTKKGKEYANRMDSDKVKIKKQGKIGAIQCCIRTTGDEPEFLIYTRKKHPFYGSQGYASGKVDYGEKVLDAARRELKEETNLDGGEGELFLIEHHIVYDKHTNELLEDKYFYFCRFENPSGELQPNDEGDFEWVPESKARDYFKKPFENIERLIYITERIKDLDAQLTFQEVTHYTDKF